MFVMELARASMVDDKISTGRSFTEATKGRGKYGTVIFGVMTAGLDTSRSSTDSLSWCSALQFGMGTPARNMMRECTTLKQVISCDRASSYYRSGSLRTSPQSIACAANHASQGCKEWFARESRVAFLQEESRRQA